MIELCIALEVPAYITGTSSRGTLGVPVQEMRGVGDL